MHVSPQVTGGLFGLGGVVVGFMLTSVAAARTRKQLLSQERERERRQRELVVAEHLDEALVHASAALDRDGSLALEDRYERAHDHWQEAWVAYSSRLRQPELLRRYRAIGALLMEVVAGDGTPKEVRPHVVARAIANARATLAAFMRGDDALPPTAFPEPTELRRLLREGDALDNPMHPLQGWLTAHPMPDFRGGADE